MKPLRILLVQVGRRRAMYPHVSPPMGILYLAGYLRSKFDTEIRLVSQRLENCSNEEVVRRAVDLNADVVGLGAVTPTARNQRDIARQVRQALPNALVVLGGPHVSAFGPRVLEETEAHVAVPGEGEHALEAVLRAHFDGGDLADVPGVMWRNEDGRVVTNPGQVPLIEDLDSLPFPAYDLIDLRAHWHRQSMPPIPRRKYVSMFSSRGCPFDCMYCHRVFGKKLRVHSAERIIEEIEYYQRQYGVKDVEFLDDIFNLDRKRLAAFCDLVGRRGLNIKIAFPNALRGDILTEEEIDALKQAGMYYASFALESGSPRIQKLIRKNLNIPRFVENIERAAKRGVFTNGFAMLGFPTETEEEMQQTIDVACNSLLHTVSFFTVTPFPGTALYETAAQLYPERLAQLSYDDMDYCSLPLNLSAVPDDVLFRYQRKANRVFFMNPVRMFRLVRDFPQRHLLPLYIHHYAYKLLKGLLSAS